MIHVNDATKTAFKTSSTSKSLVVSFPNLNYTVPMSKMVQESMTLSEKLMDKDVEFVGCYSSMFSISLRDVDQNLKGQRIVVSIQALNTETIPIFKGIVDSVSMKASKSVKDINAFDDLYTVGQKDIASWYNGLTFPITIKAFRDSLFAYIGLTQVSCDLPNDDISIKKWYEPKTLQCLPVLKYLCQINGCFGVINRLGLFEYRFIHNAYDPIYPAVTLYPSNELFPREYDPEMGGGGISDNFAYYKSIDYQEYLVNPVQRLQIRQNEEDTGVTIGQSSGNKYIIQNNMFTYEQSTAVLTKMAKRIWKKIANISFHPCDTENTGLPYIEVGDVVTYTLANTTSSGQANRFNVMSRELHGIQGLMDSYTAEGEQDQSEFITDVQAQLDAIKHGGVDMSDYYTSEEVDDILTDYPTYDVTETIIDTAVSEFEEPTGFDIMSVYTLPASRRANTLYLVQGVVVIR